MKSTALHPLLGAGLAALLAILTACGGGGGVGSGGTGQAMSASSGTVTGFASIIVDGEEYEDDDVVPRTEREWGQLVATTARLGHFAEIGFDLDGGVLRARSLRVDAAVAGPVESVDTAGQSLVVMAQRVLVNADADAGPVTVFGGVTGLAGLAAGDSVEVHGIPRWNAGTGRHDIQATRIEKLATALTSYRLSGIVRDHASGASSSTFTLGGLTVDYSGAPVLPAADLVDDGRRVIVWTSTLPAAGVLDASGVRVIMRQAGSSAVPARLGGVVGRLDAVAESFDLAGVTVHYAGAQVVPPVWTLEEGGYVQVRGHYADDGSFVADHVQLRRPSEDADDDDEEVRLEGTISNYTSDASFEVRGTEVDASGVVARPGCGSQPLGNGRRVEVEGEVRSGGATGSVVRATKLKCKRAGDDD